MDAKDFDFPVFGGNLNSHVAWFQPKTGIAVFVSNPELRSFLGATHI